MTDRVPGGANFQVGECTAVRAAEVTALLDGGDCGVGMGAAGGVLAGEVVGGERLVVELVVRLVK